MTVGRVKHILIDDGHTVSMWVEIGQAVRNFIGLYFEVSNTNGLKYELINIEKLLSSKPHYCIGTQMKYIFFLKSAVRTC